ncbi:MULTISPECIES: glycosyltransferase [Sphingobacterium]|uniref:Glycosyltransferase family 4 protein n=1 Tax=Sphingobacterium ginsenosidimutans TaxID=687845 RepID=A0ABP8A1S5_9SPHI|nr:glycosyltransferase [Sphingobacterium sp. BIGb0165]MCS4227912.1 glycosyltransferase involved in cell wall biosynthesis [Sphingobacterium sp. BIGb0165]
MTVFQISSELNIGSVGRIAEQIGEAVLAKGGKSIIAYGREGAASKSSSYKIGDKVDFYIHALGTRFTDRHGFFSIGATKKLIREIERINPDVIHMQHLHGYYINIELLFNFLATFGKPIIWTFHDCWSYTGHCAYYDLVGCSKWQTECGHCPQLGEYPKAFFKDNSRRNFLDKKRLFNSVKNLTIVPVSKWLEKEVRKSFLSSHRIKTIQNGIDVDKFRYSGNNIKTQFNIEDKFVILGVANPWDTRKGLRFFIEMASSLTDRFQIVLIGLSKRQIAELPPNIIALKRTNNIDELVDFYSSADVFVNPTLEDTFPTTNLEALACGTPVVTFDSGGSSEAVDAGTGIVVRQKDSASLSEAIFEIERNGKAYYSSNCKERARNNFKKEDRFQDYIELYYDILNKSSR